MSAVHKLVAVGIIFGVGFNLGHQEKPEVKNHTVYKIVSVPTVQVEKQTVVQKETVPLPVSCKEAVTILNDLAPYDSAISKGMGDIKYQIEQSQQQVVMKDFQSLNTTIGKVANIKDTLGNASVSKAASLVEFQKKMTECNIAVKK